MIAFYSILLGILTGTVLIQTRRDIKANIRDGNKKHIIPMFIPRFGLVVIGYGILLIIMSMSNI